MDSWLIDSDLFYFVFRPMFPLILFHLCLLLLFRLLSQGAFINNIRVWSQSRHYFQHKPFSISKFSMETRRLEMRRCWCSKRVSGQLTWVEFPCHLVLAHFIPWNRTNMLSNDDTKWNALVVAQLWCPCLRANPQLGWNQRQAIITAWNFQVVARL